MQQIMVVANDLVRRFGNTVAVDTVSFSIGSGEIVGLLGHNGAGKSTIMKLLTGFLEPDFGQIAIAGTNIADDNFTTKKIVGYLPENLPLYPDMTILDYLVFVSTVRGVAKTDRRQAVRRSIEACNLTDHAFNPIDTLSRGYRQRVGVAQAILHNPSILILDEPTNGLDPDQTQAMRDLIRTLATEATVILSTHIMQEVEALCDRALIMRDGKLALDENIDELKNSKRLRLQTTASRQQLHNTIGNVVRITKAHEQHSFWLEFNRPLTPALAADINHKLVQATIPVQALYPEQRSLEQVFRQVNAGATLNASNVS